MGKLFGTDGIRGIVGENLTVELAFHTGQAIAAVLKEEKGRAPLITIGRKDLREIVEEGKPITVECQFCDRVYTFTPEEVKALLDSLD